VDVRCAANLVVSYIGRDIMLSMRSPLFVLSAVFLICTGHCQAQTHKNSAESRNRVTTLTGILLVSDRRCYEWRGDVPRDKRTCPDGSSQWGLITLGKQSSRLLRSLRELRLHESELRSEMGKR